MKVTNTLIARKKTNVVVISKNNLLNCGLKLLVETKNKSINIGGCFSSAEELLESVSSANPDVVLYCLNGTKPENVGIIEEISESFPDTKILIILSQEDVFDQTKLLKMGVTGIIGYNQKEEVLIRAIQQVADDGVYLNEKIIAQLLGNGNGFGTNGSKHKGPFAIDPLTPRELDVIEEIGKGHTNRQIADKLMISEATVRHHLGSIYGKLQVADRLNLVIYAFKHGIVEPLALKD